MTPPLPPSSSANCTADTTSGEGVTVTPSLPASLAYQLYAGPALRTRGDTDRSTAVGS